MEAFSPKLFTSKSLERMYNEGSNNLKRGLPMKKSQICLCSAAAHALDFIDYGNKHPDYSKMKSLSLDAANGALEACMQCYLQKSPKTPEEISEFIGLLTREFGSYELFVLCNYFNSVGNSTIQATISYKAPPALAECKDYPLLNGLYLSVKNPHKQEISFDVYKAMNQALKKDCSFNTEKFVIGIPSFHNAFQKEVLMKL